MRSTPVIGEFGDFEFALADRYRFERELGRGAMGTVYLAKDVRLGRPVAIKMLHPALTNELGVKRFQSEIRIAAGLRHDHIIGVHESGEADGRLFYVMDYLGGETLRDRLKREKQLGVEEALRITEQLADGLQYAHDHGVVHRDVKPENIILAAAGGRVCVVDFGLARALGDVDAQRLTASGLAVGTPHYLSPEQASAEREIGPAADQYGLACVLYEMLVGEPPFTGPTASAIAMRHISEAAPPLKARRKSVPAGVDAAVRRAMEKVPADRFGSLHHFSAELRATANSAAVSENAWRAPATSGSRRTWIAAAAAVMVFGAVGVSIARTNLSAEDSVDDGLRWLTNRTIDTTRIMVFPFKGATAAARTVAVEQRVRDALNHWNGISVVSASETQAVIEGQGKQAPAPSERALARATAAGRFIIGSVLVSPEGARVSAELWDARGNAPPRVVTATVTADAGVEDSAFAHLVYGLLFGAQGGAQYEPMSRNTNSFSAFRSYVMGRTATKTWALKQADSAFARALRQDPDFTPAVLALAQVRTWMRDESPETAGLVSRALNAAGKLTRVEVLHAEGLEALASGRYESACRRYHSLVASDSLDFGAWYGLGECERRDSAVVTNRASPSGRSFRGSAHHAFAALSRAFELLPRIDACCAARADDVLRRALTTSTTHVKRGLGASPDTTHYTAYPELAGDTIAYIPYPVRDLLRPPPATHTLVIDQQRKLFFAIAARRVIRSPGDAAALEELAEAMELRGARGTIDTLRRARALTRDSSQALRLAVREVWLRVKGALPDSPKELSGARAMAESLVVHSAPRSAQDATLLASLAILIGDASRASRLAVLGAEAMESRGLSAEVMGLAGAYLVFAAIGGPRDSLIRREELLSTAIANDVVQDRQAFARDFLLGRPAVLAYPAYRGVSLEMLDTADYLVAAERANARGDHRAVRRILEDVARMRNKMRAADITLDALYPEAWLLAAAGDTAGALRRIGDTLNAVSVIPSEVFFEMPNAGALVRAVALRAELSRARNTTASRQWLLAARILAPRRPG